MPPATRPSGSRTPPPRSTIVSPSASGRMWPPLATVRSTSTRAVADVDGRGLGAVLPDPDRLLADVQSTRHVVGNTTLGLRADVPSPPQNSLDPTVVVAVGQFVLVDATVPCVGEHVRRSGDGAAIEAQTFTLDRRGDAAGGRVGDVRQLTRRRIDRVHADSPTADNHDVACAAGRGEAAPHVDVAEEALR